MLTKSLTILQEVQRLRMSGAFPARNYCVTPAGHSIKSVTFCPPSPKKSLQSPRKNTLPDGTNPYKTHVPVRFHFAIVKFVKSESNLIWSVSIIYMIWTIKTEMKCYKISRNLILYIFFLNVHLAENWKSTKQANWTLTLWSIIEWKFVVD